MPVYSWKLLFRRLFLVLASYSVIRLIFLFNNRPQFHGEPVGHILYAFIHGLRFDLWSVLWLNLPLVAFAVLPYGVQGWRASQGLIKFYFLVVNAAFLGVNVIDTELFHFTGKRMSMEWLHLQQDVQEQSWGMILYYWPFTVIFLTLTAVVYRFYPKWQWPKRQSFPKWWQQILVSAVSLSLVFLGLRGGAQLKPLDLPHAYMKGSVNIGVLTLNSTFSFLKNRLILDEVAVRFFDNDEEPRHMVRQAQQRTSPFSGTLKGWNVMVIIVESLGSEYVGAANGGKGYTPFLDRLADKGQLFANSFANGRRSIEAIPSVFCAFPSLMTEALVLSPYQGIQLNCLGQMAEKAGYSTIFFHGAHNGSMHVDALAARAGFSEFIGYEEYPDKAQTDGYWGIYDEPFFDYALTQLNKIKKPFAAGFFTLSSHSPYHIPDSYRGRFPKGTLEIHESIGYTDYALEKFFSLAEKQDWFNHTIFILTGDHTQKSDNVSYQNLTGGYRVPILVYVPGAPQIRAERERIVQHVDILPTVVDLLALEPQDMSLFGQSFYSASPGLNYNCFGYGYYLLDRENLVVYHSQQKRYELFRHDPTFAMESLQDTEALSERRRLLEALVDYFNVAVTRNRLNQPFHAGSTAQ